MAANSNIEWTQATWNCLAGCEAVSPGCANCYAKTMTRRLEAMGQADYTGLTTDKHFNGVVRCLPHKLDIPLKRRKPTIYFVNSMSDLFHEDVPFDFIDRVFAIMADCPRHTFQVLTKRARRMAKYFEERDLGDVYTNILRMADGEKAWSESPHDHLRSLIKLLDNWEIRDGYQSTHAPPKVWPLPNVWLGVSCEDQQTANERIPLLLQTPAAVRWVSAEPLLGPIDLSAWLQSPYPQPATYGDGYYSPWGEGMAIRNAQWKPGLHWLVVGGESGHGARPMHPDWARDLRNQCRAAEVPFFFKQWGGWAPTTADKIRGKHTDNGLYVLPNGRYGNQGDWWDGRAECMEKVGKHAAGRLLDGQEHSEYPHIPEPA